MAERKYDRPTRLKAIELPGSMADDEEQAHEDFLTHIRDGLAGRRYGFGDILPPVSRVGAQCGLPEDEVRRAIRELRNERLLQLHDR